MSDLLQMRTSLQLMPDYVLGFSCPLLLLTNTSATFNACSRRGIEERENLNLVKKITLTVQWMKRKLCWQQAFIFKKKNQHYQCFRSLVIAQTNPLLSSKLSLEIAVGSILIRILIYTIHILRLILYESKDTSSSTWGAVWRCSATFSSSLKRRKVHWGSRCYIAVSRRSWKMINDTTHPPPPNLANMWTNDRNPRPNLHCVQFITVTRHTQLQLQMPITHDGCQGQICSVWALQANKGSLADRS